MGAVPLGTTRRHPPSPATRVRAPETASGQAGRRRRFRVCRASRPPGRVGVESPEADPTDSTPCTGEICAVHQRPSRRNYTATIDRDRGVAHPRSRPRLWSSEPVGGDVGARRGFHRGLHAGADAAACLRAWAPRRRSFTRRRVGVQLCAGTRGRRGDRATSPPAAPLPPRAPSAPQQSPLSLGVGDRDVSRCRPTASTTSPKQTDQPLQAESSPSPRVVRGSTRSRPAERPPARSSRGSRPSCHRW